MNFYNCIVSFSFVILFTIQSFSQEDFYYRVWQLNNQDSIAGFKTTFLIDKPDKIKTQFGESLYFDGINDGLLINHNPVAGFTNFTIEILFMPDSSSNLDNYEQRFLHIKNSDDSRRILIELRLVRNNKWSLDTFIKSENSRCTLIDTSLQHPTNQWYHVALTYSDGLMKHYVNGNKELEGKVDYQPIDSEAKISIGVRQNMKSWFKGTISYISFTNKSLNPEEFLLLRKIHY
ncbi:LamG domain-containing protein [Rosettibacter firmus]|uniref:LamG domain-containing protein n=1 Tax=Rosettibacter firmus TaxID=3111522 RepID=UPI00336BC7EA